MENTAIALGTFDGVHIAHKAVLSAAANSKNSVAVAFCVPPKAFFTDSGIILTDIEEKNQLIKDIGINTVDYLDFKEVKNISPEDFFNYLKKKYAPTKIVCGYDYTFGKGGEGNTPLLKKLCEESGISLLIIDKVSVDQRAVSSSLIRQLLKNGETKKANSLLGHPFSFKSKVIHGQERGRKINFPTVNQLIDKTTAQVKFGVYMTKAQIGDKEYYGMTNIGLRPTFPCHSPICETHFFDLDENLYDKDLRLYLLEFIREEKKFSGLTQLKAAIEKDKEYIITKIGKI